MTLLGIKTNITLVNDFENDVYEINGYADFHFDLEEAFNPFTNSYKTYYSLIAIEFEEEANREKFNKLINKRLMNQLEQKCNYFEISDSREFSFEDNNL